MGDAACKIVGSVNRIDNPDVFTAACSAFFAQKAIVREGCCHTRPDELFDGQISLGHRILRPFERKSSRTAVKMLQGEAAGIPDQRVQK